ncbi:MAG: class I SAM-dependent methyltransferase [Acidimicrobiaceae bacterium]|nr:class I SAM-dependent methyltransferase [Acidimicrobiaceae bacterium]MYG98134.1 class I SAM-dependent methyltransferase [Acidimicrobiaceae bacterium]MYL02732.1 class I SAM-dependent methyltransferase [Acidimicrobiaceae bacterium]
MLTVDYGRLDVRAGERVLDLGCGFGRHSYEALKRGAEVVACDLARPEVEQVRDLARLLVASGEVDESVMAAPVQGNALGLPFDDDSFDRVIAAEVLEHISDDESAFAELARVLRPGGRLAVTIPSWLAETVCWKLSSDYHAPAVPGGHVRIYRLRGVRRKLTTAGLQPGGSHRAHALHSPYWWLRCAVGPNREVSEHRLVGAYHRLLEWDIVKRPFVTAAAERLLNPLLGKSLVVYADKPLRASDSAPVRQSEDMAHAA